MLNIVINLYYKFIFFTRGFGLMGAPYGWSIGWDDAIILEKEIRRYLQYEKVTYVEIGSGFSTVFCSKICNKFYKKYQVYSLEEDGAWADKTISLFKRLNVDVNEKYAHINIVKTKYTFNNIADCLNEIAKAGPIDVLFIDAPPDIFGADIRLKVANLAISALHKKSTLILHDTSRAEELYAVSVLAKRFLSHEVFKTTKGITVFRFPNGE